MRKLFLCAGSLSNDPPLTPAPKQCIPDATTNETVPVSFRTRTHAPRKTRWNMFPHFPHVSAVLVAGCGNLSALRKHFRISPNCGTSASRFGPLRAVAAEIQLMKVAPCAAVHDPALGSRVLLTSFATVIIKVSAFFRTAETHTGGGTSRAG